MAFGVAPAMLFYFSVGIHYGKIGSLLSAIYVVFGAIRLARFNVMIGVGEPSVFIGLPIPTSAITLAMWSMIYDEYCIPNYFEIVLLIGIALLSILMVSNIRYPSFKRVDLEKPNFLKVLIYLTIASLRLYISIH